METQRVYIGKRNFFHGMSFEKIEDQLIGQAVVLGHNGKEDPVGEVFSISEENDSIYAEVRIDTSRLPGHIMTEEEIQAEMEEEKRILEEFEANKSKEISIKAVAEVTESCILNKIE